MSKYQRFELTYNGDTEVLEINPDGWNENGQSFQRDKIYHGVFQSFTADSYRFARKSGGGGDFILTAYEADGIAASVDINIYLRNTQTDDYDLTYTGILNFDPDKFSIERDFVEVSFIESNNIQDFFTRDEIEIDLNARRSLDDEVITTIEANEITFKKVDIFRITDFEADYSYKCYLNNTPVPALDAQGYTQEAVSEIDFYAYAELISINEIGDDFLADNGPDYADRSPYILTNSTGQDLITDVVYFQQTGTTTIEMTFDKESFQALQDTFIVVDIKMFAKVFDESETQLFSFEVDSQRVDLDEGGGDTFPQTIDVNLDVSSLEGQRFTSPDGGYFTIVINFDIQTRDNCVMSMDRQTIYSVRLSNKSLGAADSIIDCYYPHEAFNRALQIITGEQDIFYSEFFGRTDSEFRTYSSDGAGAFYAVTSGWNLREFPKKEFLISLKKLFQSFDGIFSLGMSYDKTNTRFYIEQKEEFYDIESYMFDVGEIKELTIRPFKDAYVNEIVGGYDGDGKYENFQGVNEFNLKSNHSLTTPIKDKLKVQAPYNTDTISMELARRKNYDEYSQEDTDYDEGIYIVSTENDITKTDFPDATGFSGIDEYYNLDITPRENIIRWGKWINSGKWKEDSFTIKFQKNTKLLRIGYTNQNGDFVSELDDIQSSELSDVRLFNPEYYEFEGSFDESWLTVLNTNPHGIVSFQFNGTNYEGFIDSIQTKEYEKKADYKLIAHEASAADKDFMDDDNALFMDDDQHEFL